MKLIRQICRKDNRNKDIYLGVDENLFIIYADTCFDFKFAFIQSILLKKNFNHKNKDEIFIIESMQGEKSSLGRMIWILRETSHPGKIYSKVITS